MIKLKPELFAVLDTQDGLLNGLQQAIQLEHATIPPYLYALYSIRPNSNTEIRHLIRSIVIEEMLHMALACNLLNALGGSPVIDRPEFVPQYPTHLPGAVESGLEVKLARFSLELVETVFMVIEEPETPLHFPEALVAAPPQTIGQFYNAIKQQIMERGESLFVGDRAKQVTSEYWPNELIKVTDVNSAVHAIEIIVEQGEGTTKSPLSGKGSDIAHYYRFAQILHHKKLIPNPHPPAHPRDDQKFVYGGEPIPFDPNGVLPVIENPKAAHYPAGFKARLACDTFNSTYTSILKALHLSFNGSPDQLEDAIDKLMVVDLKQQAMDVMAIDLGDGTKAGPSFEYYPSPP